MREHVKLGLESSCFKQKTAYEGSACLVGSEMCIGGSGKAAKFLAKINMESIQETISSTAAGMEFFRTIAGALAHEGKPVRWTTPTGFTVVQKYSCLSHTSDAADELPRVALCRPPSLT